MNSKQRRLDTRYRHTRLPIGKAIEVQPLIGRTVYAYRMGRYTDLDADTMTRVVSAKISRHVYPGTNVDVALRTAAGKDVMIKTSRRGLRLLNPVDRAIRPWWCDLRRETKGMK